MTAPRSPGRIVTFYSYKGGTGRSMALANVAWILASHRQRVLCIDWDLEAPGLHRYFHPFLDDPELASSPGLVDFLGEFVTAAAQKGDSETAEGRPWFHDYASPLGYAVPVDGPFPEEGVLDLLPAGRQGPSYASFVTSFDWGRFYDTLGGGVFLEAVKQRLREEYDYVLIDSRTGLSDTSGICTVQMPDDLVVCFTLNRQSMQGAAAVAASAYAQRLKPNGEPGLAVWPVPMRVELNEKQRLERARDTSRALFQRYLMHLARDQRERYWGQVEVMYQPYFAFEEELATVVEKKHQANSILASMEAITAHLSRGEVKELALGERERRVALRRYEAPASPQAFEAPVPRRVHVSYPRARRELAERLVQGLLSRGVNARFDLWEVQPGEHGSRPLESARDSAAVVGFITPESQQDPIQTLVLDGMDAMAPSVWSMPPSLWLVEEGVDPPAIAPHPDIRTDYVRLRVGGGHADVVEVAEWLIPILQLAAPLHPEDPHKEQWGGASARNGRELRAEVRAVSEAWFDVRLEVVSTSSPPLAGTVEFHLHPTFTPPVQAVDAVDGRASLRLGAWGAFTVGVLADGGRTRLELDLAELPDAPPRFRER